MNVKVKYSNKTQKCWANLVAKVNSQFTLAKVNNFYHCLKFDPADERQKTDCKILDRC